jgi:hypothetical protein
MKNGKKQTYSLLNEDVVDFFCCIYIINRIRHLLGRGRLASKIYQHEIHQYSKEKE